MSNEIPDKAFNTVFSMLEKVARIDVALPLLSILLAIDVAISIKFGKNILSFEWTSVEGSPSLGFLIVAIVIYAVFMSIIVPSIKWVCTFAVIKILSFFESGHDEFNKLRYVDAQILRDEALKEQNSFMLDVHDKESIKLEKSIERMDFFSLFSYSCLLLLLADLLIAPNSIANELFSYLDTLGGMIGRIVKFATIISFVVIFSPIIISTKISMQRRLIDYPPLAKKLYEQSEQAKGHIRPPWV